MTVAINAQPSPPDGQFADKSHYLIDSLELEELTHSDLKLLDSVLTLYHTATHDTDRLNALGILCENMMHNSWHKYQFLQYATIERLIEAGPLPILENKYLSSLADAVNNLGYIYDAKGDYIKGLECYHKSLEIYEKLAAVPDEAIAKEGKVGVANSLNNIGFIYKNQGDISMGLEYYHKSLMIYEELGAKRGLANALNNIGVIYQNQGDLAQALIYGQRSLRILEDLNDKRGMANSLSNIGSLYDGQGNLAEGLEYYNRSLNILEAIGDKNGVARSLNNMGSVYHTQGDVTQGLECYIKSLKIHQEMGNKSGMASVLNNIGVIYLDINDLKKARTNALKSLKLAREMGFPESIKRAARLLFNVNKSEGHFKEALHMYELFVQMRDSTNNDETQKATIRQQTKYEFEKAMLVKEQEEKEKARLKAEVTDRRDDLQYSVILIAILVLFGGVLALGFINVSERMAEGIIFFSFLILFEFLLVLADPYIEGWSGGAPGIKLLFNAGVAALIFPAHAFFESRLKGRFVKT